jgi:hypothetical protein
LTLPRGGDEDSFPPVALTTGPSEFVLRQRSDDDARADGVDPRPALAPTDRFRGNAQRVPALRELAREQTFALWSLTTNILNGALFVLIGIEAQSAIRAVPNGEIPALVALTLAAWVAIIVIRFVFQMVTVWLIRLLDRRPSQRTRACRTVHAWSRRSPVSAARSPSPSPSPSPRP